MKPNSINRLFKKSGLCGILAVMTLAGSAALRAEVVFTDTFLYTAGNAFLAEGGWTTLVPGGTLGSNYGVAAGEGKMWGNPTGGTGNSMAAVEYNYATPLAVGDTITMDANVLRGGGYQYGMRMFLWDGTDAGTRTPDPVAGGSQSPTAAGALNQVTYSVSGADIAAGHDHVIFRFSHDLNWGETADVTFSVDPPPEGWMWKSATGGSWATPANWDPAGPADEADKAALVNLVDITGDETITLDGARTIGSLRFADAAGADGNWILAPGSGGALTLSAPVNLAPGIDVANQTATVGVTLSGTEGMAKTGGGTLVLSGVNDYSGNTLVKAGRLRVGNAGAIPSGAGKGDVTLTGTLDLNDTNVTINGLTGSGPVTNSGTGPVTLTIGAGDADGLTYAGAIGNGTGVTSLAKTGSGTLTLTGIHGFSGTITGNDGTLVLGGGYNRLHNVAGVTVNSGATVNLDGGNMFVIGHGIKLADSRVLAVNGGTLLMGTNMVSRIGNVSLSNEATWTINSGLAGYDVLLSDTVSGPATVSVANTGGNTAASILNTTAGGGLHLGGVQNFNVDDVTGDAAADLSVLLPLAGPGTYGGAAGGLNKLGSGTLLLDANNTYRGNTIVSEGALEVGYYGALVFAPGANGVSNKVTGAGSAKFGGRFEIDLTGADTTNGNNWTLVDVATKSYVPADFIITGFNEENDVHTMEDGDLTWIFDEATGVLSLANSAATDYDTWAGGYWTTGAPNSARGEDFDADGVSNFEEYAFGLVPNSGSSVNPISQMLDKTSGVFKHTRRNPALGTGLAYSYEYSTDLKTWLPLPPASATGDNASPVETVTVTAPSALLTANPKLFVRVLAK